ncbi:hypothetical protein YC2023_085915 [Brassica napus]
MVKSGRGGTKRKIDKMEKIPKREYRATTFSKRCSGLHSKAAQLCLLADAQIAILATPPSSQSNVSFFSFGHSSVDAVVNAYLTGQRLAPVREEPMEEDIGVLMARKELGLELWWEKESLCESKDPRELMDAVKAMERMLSKLRSGDFVSDEEDLIKSNVVLHQGTQEPDDDLPHEGLDVYNQEMDIDELIDWTTFESSVFDDGVLDSTQELAGINSTNFEAAAHDVSTNPNPPIYNYYHEGVEDEALVFQNKAANDVSEQSC